MKTLVAGITEHEVTTAFVSSIMKMQQIMTTRPGISVGFEFFASVNKALTHFDKAKEFDALVLVDGNMSVDHDFLLNEDADRDFVVASYAIRTLDWDRAREKLVDPECTEPPEYTATTYNFDTATGHGDTLTSSAMYIKNPTILQAKVCRLTRRVLDTIVEKHADVVRSDDGTIVAHAPAILDGRALDADQALLTLWGGDVFVDISAKTQNMGALDYTGCVGQRKVLR